MLYSLNKIWALIEEKKYPPHIVKEKVKELDKILSRIANSDGDQGLVISHSLNHDQLKQAITERFLQLYQLRLDEIGISSDHFEVNKVIEYIKYHYHEPLSVKMLAKYVAMDGNYLSSLFKKKTGESLIHFIQSVRIEHAKYKLTQTDLPIKKSS